jgi:hypothetical protein
MNKLGECNGKDRHQVVLIDGCFLGCHGRIIEHLVGKENLVRFDALSVYKKYTDRFDIDSVPEEERTQAAREVADRVLADLGEGISRRQEPVTACGCESGPRSSPTCAG